MADTFTANLNLNQPQVGGSQNTWGGKLNADLTLIDDVFAAAGTGTSVGVNIGSGKILKITGSISASGLTISAAEVSYLDGVTSPIQAQIAAKAASGANSDITSLSGLTTALSLVQGGTGGTTAAAARASLIAAQSGANADITSITGLTTALAITQGGTGAITAPLARAALSAAAAGANSDITSLAGLTTPLSAAQGGTGANALTNNSAVIGGGAGAIKLVAPGAVGNVLTSNGITWTSVAGGGGGGGSLIGARSYFCGSFYS